MFDSATVQGLLRKAVAAITGFMLGLVLLTALLLAGFYLLVKAATLALSPWLGEAGALAVTGFACLLLLALFFYRMTRPVSSGKSGSEEGEDERSARSPIEVLRNLIRENPLEAAFTAFAVGILEQGDPRLKSLLLQGGMVLMKRAEAEEPSDPAQAGTVPESESGEPPAAR